MIKFVLRMTVAFFTMYVLPYFKEPFTSIFQLHDNASLRASFLMKKEIEGRYILLIEMLASSVLYKWADVL